ncbi:hypothetical protein D0T84_13640 [Dysgonomonas sp. 521]|nr:hypothetical protein [Dysgonomonas sp. 521]
MPDRKTGIAGCCKKVTKVTFFITFLCYLFPLTISKSSLYKTIFYEKTTGCTKKVTACFFVGLQILIVGASGL